MAVASQASNSGTSTFSMSLGLASILNERDLIDIPREGTPPRSVHQAVSSNPARFPSLVSDTHYFSAGTASTATTLTLPTNSYNLIPSPSTLSERSNRGQGHVGETKYETENTNIENTSVETTVPNLTLNVDRYMRNGENTGLSRGYRDSTGSQDSDSSALGVINRLRNTGFSLYGYFSNTGSQTASATGNSEVTRPNSLPVSVTAVSFSSATIPGSSVAMAASGDASVSLVTAGETPSTESGRMSHLTSFLTRKTAGSVLGALTKYKQDRPF